MKRDKAQTAYEAYKMKYKNGENRGSRVKSKAPSIYRGTDKKLHRPKGTKR